MTRDELLSWMQEQYDLNGYSALDYAVVKQTKGLYWALYDKGLPLKAVISELGLSEGRDAYQNQMRWSAVLEDVRPIFEEHGVVLPGQWFQQNGLGRVVAAVYACGRTWGDVRDHFDSHESSNFVEARNGTRWRSHPEASLSNFLFARGIEHRKGEKYPDEFSDQAEARYAWYDMHFRNMEGLWIDVEVWGDKPNGHAEERYAVQRAAKERFNAANPHFIGIPFRSCFEEDELTEILEPFIGRIEPYIFGRDYDPEIETTHWSNADELIETCRKLARLQPDGQFPTEEWLRKRGKWADREGPAYNTLSIYIARWIGGIRKLRGLIGQPSVNTRQWHKKSAINAYKKWYEQYGFTASQARQRVEKLSDLEKRRAANITAAVKKYHGSVVSLNADLGITVKKKAKWSRDRVLTETSRLFVLYGLVPSQISRLREDELAKAAISIEDVKLSKQIVDRISAYFDGSKDLYKVAEISPKDMRIIRREKGW